MANIKHAVLARSAPFSAIVARVEAIDWAQVTADLDGQGCCRPEGIAVAGGMPRAGCALSR